MIVLFGLGNNELKYFQTKHNIGRVVLENLAKKWSLEFKRAEKFSWAKLSAAGADDVWLVYSNGYMNNSGEALAAFVKYFKLDVGELKLVVLQDDSDQSEGVCKLTQGGGSAGHHGINSIYKNILGLHMSADQVWRLKIGIRPAGNRLRSETFVLKPLTEADSNLANELVTIIHEKRDLLFQFDSSKLQSTINSLKIDKKNG